MARKKGEGKITLVCPVCSKEFLVYKCHIRSSNVCCSRKCSEKIKSRKNKKFITFECELCGKISSKRKGSEGLARFCSLKCMSKKRGILMSGENHPNWKGGISARKWSSRKAILEKLKDQMSCEDCGSTKYLQGHHISKYSSSPELRNDKKNIKILCIECHALYHPELTHFILSRKK